MMNWLTTRLPAAAVLAAVTALAPVAAAEDDEDRPKKKKLIVTVEDNDEITPVEQAKKKAARRAPEVGDSEAEIKAYLRELDADVRSIQLDLRAARQGSDGDEVLRLEKELQAAKALRSDEEDRLTTKEPGLVAGGATLTALGGASLVSSLVLLVVWGFSAIDGNDEEEYGWGALGTLGFGVIGLSAGIPMVVAGNKRRPRDPDEEAFRLAPDGVRPAVGLTVRVSF
jgi:hypothetical protein